MKKIVIAIDSFKGCLRSSEAIEAASKGVHAVFPDCNILPFPISDGGEGVLEVLLKATSGSKKHIWAHDPLMNKRTADYGISQDGQTAFIEMAAISGLPLVPIEKRNPLLTTTYGTGELIRDALDHGCRNFIIGIGGSATNDAGIGMLQALGFRFLNATGKEVNIGCGQVLAQIASIDTHSIHPALQVAHFTVACDVDNPFHGPEGAAHVFASQKGADQEMIATLDAGMSHLATIFYQATGKDVTAYPGTGAAGGLGGALLAFLNATLQPGIQLLLELLHFSEQAEGADCIITGEGKADRQTLRGKVAFGILQQAQKQNIPVILIAGKVEDVEALKRAGFRYIRSINPPYSSLVEAMQPELATARIQQTISQLLLQESKQSVT